MTEWQIREAVPGDVAEIRAVAETERVVGYCSGGEANGTGYLGAIYVGPDQQRSGIGTGCSTGSSGGRATVAVPTSASRSSPTTTLGGVSTRSGATGYRSAAKQSCSESRCRRNSSAARSRGGR